MNENLAFIRSDRIDLENGSWFTVAVWCDKDTGEFKGNASGIKELFGVDSWEEVDCSPAAVIKTFKDRANAKLRTTGKQGTILCWQLWKKTDGIEFKAQPVHFVAYADNHVLFQAPKFEGAFDKPDVGILAEGRQALMDGNYVQVSHIRAFRALMYEGVSYCKWSPELHEKLAKLKKTASELYAMFDVELKDLAKKEDKL